ncbi:MAG TPA: inositol monophosphatase family protein [Methylophilaceae bacterium]|nr:inositol monophosphatase family protein [Methylophilaceae bacterium]
MQEDMLEKVIELARGVGDNVVMQHYLKVARQRKHDGTALTEADLEAQAALEVGLKAILDCPIVGEEMTASEQQRNWGLGANGVWCVDPIDGTSNFIAGLPQFAVCIAYLEQGRPLLGVVYAPALNELFYAEKGQGAYLVNAAGKVQLPITRFTGNEAIHLREAIAEVDFKRLPRNLALALAGNPPFQAQRNYGAASLDWCYLAAGRFEVDLHGGQKLWDYAAACVVLEEAGGSMRSLESQDFWEGDIWHKSVIAAGNAELFQEWTDWVAQNS